MRQRTSASGAKTIGGSLVEDSKLSAFHPRPEGRHLPRLLAKQEKGWSIT
jgi:hypothetical protein